MNELSASVSKRSKGGGGDLGFKFSPVTLAKGEVAFNNEEEVY